ncbi:hypothetical protein PRUB_a0090 [Pseudoalteromonas rubra]|uniref:Baseplate protein J-like domain-containing protein n=1 Tax=Pseudoalteromonas rubra TaxID=43658 RepID=A0A8T0C527_9GAMM|nr:hypothetical protein [Pseudoalteromonas rubra]KAF7785723.1 hypothetical protein PRUB_a0090 [Pseudoalteromonas rubra]
MKQSDIANTTCCSTLSGTTAQIPPELKPGYFQAEPRDTLYWLHQFKQWSVGLDGQLNQLLPEGISELLLAEYIADPRAVIDQNVLSQEQIEQLQQPQRIVLFYFLKKLSKFNEENKTITTDFKNYIARNILGFEPNPALAERIITFLDLSAAPLLEQQNEDIELKAYVEGRDRPLKYEVECGFDFHAINLKKLMSVNPDVVSKSQFVVTDYKLPLYNPHNLKASKQNTLHPLAPVEAKRGRVFERAWAFSSELLNLSQGTRTITLTLDISDEFGSTQAKDIKVEHVNFFISTAAGWEKLNTPTQNKDCPCEFTFKLSAEFPPIVAISQPEPYEAFAADAPSIKIVSNQQWSIVCEDLTVEVNGLTPELVRNQDTVMSPEGSLVLFGDDAPEQAIFSFAHPELALKPISEMNLTLHWLGKPKDLTEYYKAYDKPQADFKVQVNTIKESKVVGVAKDQALFKTCSIEKKSEQTEVIDTINPSSNQLPNQATNQSENASSDTLEVETCELTEALNNSDWKTAEADPLSQDLYFEIQLTGQSFGHAEYPLLMTNYAVDFAAYRKLMDEAVQKLIDSIANELLVLKKLLESDPNPELTSLIEYLEQLTKTLNAQPSLTAMKREIETSIILLAGVEKHGESIEPLVNQLTAFVQTLVAPTPVNLPYIPQINRLDIFYKSPGNRGADVRTYRLEPAGYMPVAHHKGALEHEESSNKEGLNKGCKELGDSTHGQEEKNDTDAVTRIDSKPKAEDTRHLRPLLGLYFGLENLLKSKESRLFFHGIPGDSNRPKVAIRWSYLAKTGWRELDKYLIEDGTYGLTQSGLLRWITPDDIENNNPLMPTGTYWIAAVPTEEGLIPGCKDKSQDQANSQENSQDYEAYKALMTIQAVRSNGFIIRREIGDLQDCGDITQLPVDSKLFLDGKREQLPEFYTIAPGKEPETEEELWTRAFSSVRYKGRAVTVKDFEDFILTRFGNVMQVKCIPAVFDNSQTLTPDEPITVKAVIVEKNQSLYQPYPLKRKVARQLLKDITKQVLTQTTPFMSSADTQPPCEGDRPIVFEAVNPTYRNVSFRIVVKFRTSQQEEDNKRALLAALEDFINPWVKYRDTPLKFGCWFTYGELLSYLQQIECVEAILNLKLSTADGRSLCPTKSDVFQPDQVAIFCKKNTTIEVVDHFSEYDPSKYQGIGYMKINQDFYVK